MKILKCKTLLIFCTFILAVCIASAFSACGDTDNTHTHNWSSVYTEDGERHYQTCDGCNEKNYNNHSYGVSGICVCGKQKPDEVHTHVYDKTVATADYIKSDADCTHGAVYFYSCGCGKKGTTTFEAGEPNGHTFTAEEIAEEYKKSDADCTHKAVYFKSCTECGEKGEETFEVGVPDGHTFTAEEIAEAYKKSDADCTHKAVYFKSCTKCGEKSEETFEVGEPNGHNFENGICTICLNRKPSEGLEYEIVGDEACLKGMGTCSDTVIVIADIYENKPVTSIGGRAFYNRSKITNVIIPDSVTSIGVSAFDYCNNIQFNEYENALYLGNENNPYLALISANGSISSCEVNEKTKIIGPYAFSNSEWLRMVNIGKNVITICDGAFRACSRLNDILIPNNVINIGSFVYAGCNLKNLTIPDSIVNIGRQAFACSFESITIGSGLKSIEGDSLGCSRSKLTSITVSDKNATFHSAGNCLIKTATKTLIMGCKTSVIPDDGSVTIIGESSFYACEGLIELKIPEGVKSIESEAFKYCTELVSLSVPDSIVNIEEGILDACNKFQYNTYYDGTFTTSFIGNKNNGYKILMSVKNPYNQTTYEVYENTKIMGSHAFSRFGTLTCITIPVSVMRLEYKALGAKYDLSDIYYKGTKEQWNAISKDPGWNYNVDNYTIHCSDGDIVKN